MSYTHIATKDCKLTMGLWVSHLDFQKTLWYTVHFFNLNQKRGVSLSIYNVIVEMWIENSNIQFALVLREETLRTQCFWQMVTRRWPFLFCESLCIAKLVMNDSYEAVTIRMRISPSRSPPRRSM